MYKNNCCIFKRLSVTLHIILLKIVHLAEEINNKRFFETLNIMDAKFGFIKITSQQLFLKRVK